MKRTTIDRTSGQQTQDGEGGWQVWALAIRALGFFLLLDLGSRFLSFPRIQKYLTGGPARQAAHWTEESGSRQARRTFRAIQNATKFYYRSRKDCLPKALATFHLLRRQRVPAQLCFGVKKFPFAAHSWVEAYGEVLDDNPQSIGTYSVIERVES